MFNTELSLLGVPIEGAALPNSCAAVIARAAASTSVGGVVDTEFAWRGVKNTQVQCASCAPSTMINTSTGKAGP